MLTSDLPPSLRPPVGEGCWELGIARLSLLLEATTHFSSLAVVASVLASMQLVPSQASEMGPLSVK